MVKGTLEQSFLLYDNYLSEISEDVKLAAKQKKSVSNIIAKDMELIER
jgi:hypothetical protein